MSFKHFAFWMCLAGGMFAFIFLFQRNGHQAASGSPRILANLRPSAVTSIQVRPQGQLEIRAERAHGSWNLAEPLVYPADKNKIDGLLDALYEMTPAALISRREIDQRPNAEEEYGFSSPQATVIIRQGGYLIHLFIGSRTAPGNQVFVQVVGRESIFVVDAGLLKFLPAAPNDWRDTRLFALEGNDVSRVSVTNGSKTFELSRQNAGSPWQIITPGARARGDTPRIENLLTNVEALNALQFVSDNPSADLEPYGLQNPDLQIGFADGTNALGILEIGRSPTNAPDEYYALAGSGRHVVTISKAVVDPLRSANELRDPHLITSGAAISAIHIHGREDFTLARETNGLWRMEPGGEPADSELAAGLADGLRQLRISKVVKEVVTQPDLPAYGLAKPMVGYDIVTSPGTSNIVVSFSAEEDGTVFARRADESAVYAVNPADLRALGSARFQFRDRRIWDVPVDEISAVSISKSGGERRLVRKAKYDWSLGPGSQGVIEPLAIEETVRPLCHLKAVDWIARGETNRPLYGLTNGDFQLTLETSKGGRYKIEFGQPLPNTLPCAAVSMDGDLWVFELPPRLCRDVMMYLSAPGGA